ncbi:MAG: prepilin-type N-terminal cleavage/methylation domain-containing protein [Desulfobacterales bacterium]
MERHRLNVGGFSPGSVGLPHGFTLIELLVVLVLIGLAVGFAAPRWVAALPGVQLSTSARKAAAMLRYAGTRAVSEQAVYKAVIDMESRSIDLTRVDEGRRLLPPERDEEEDVSADTESLLMPEAVDIERAADGWGQEQIDRLNIFFFPRGGNSGGWMVLAHESGRRLVIRVDSITGAVKVREPEYL